MSNLITASEKTSMYYKLLDLKLLQKRQEENIKINKEKEYEQNRIKIEREKLENSIAELARYERLRFNRLLMFKSKLGSTVDITV